MTPAAKRLLLSPKMPINPKVLALRDRLNAGLLPACILVQGDSTGNDGNEWVEYLCNWLKAKYPQYTFYKPLWNDTYQCYDPFRRAGGTTRVQTGINGDAYASFTGVLSNYIQVAHSAAQAITGDIDIRVKVLPDDWTPSAQQIIISKYGPTDPNRGWFLALNTSGTLSLYWCPNGNYASQVNMASTAAVGVADGIPTWLRTTLDVDNDAGGYSLKFYKSTTYDGDYWTQIGDERIGAAPTTLPNISIPLELGNRTSGGSGNAFTGKIYEAHVLSGIEGECVASPNMDQAFPAGTTSFKDLQGNTVTVSGAAVTVGNGSPGVLILNASCAGKQIAYSADATRFAKQTPIEPQLAFINYSHNEGADVDYIPNYDELVSAILTKYPNALPVCTAQNPKTAPTTYIEEHAIRCKQILDYAKSRGYGYVDAYNGLTKGGLSICVGADGVHPTETGSRLWANIAAKYLQQAGRFTA